MRQKVLIFIFIYYTHDPESEIISTECKMCTILVYFLIVFNRRLFNCRHHELVIFHVYQVTGFINKIYNHHISDIETHSKTTGMAKTNTTPKSVTVSVVYTCDVRTNAAQDIGNDDILKTTWKALSDGADEDGYMTETKRERVDDFAVQNTTTTTPNCRAL